MRYITVQLWHVPIDQIWSDFDSVGEIDEEEKLVIIAKRAAELAGDEFRQDVLDRKMCIATGSGQVHGDQIKVADFGITLAPAAVEELEEDYVSV